MKEVWGLLGGIWRHVWWQCQVLAALPFKIKPYWTMLHKSPESCVVHVTACPLVCTAATQKWFKTQQDLQTSVFLPSAFLGWLLLYYLLSFFEKAFFGSSLGCRVLAPSQMLRTSAKVISSAPGIPPWSYCRNILASETGYLRRPLGFLPVLASCRKSTLPNYTSEKRSYQEAVFENIRLLKTKTQQIQQ